jgi:hypothetical protein
MDAAEAISGLRVVSRTPPSAQFLPSTPGDFEMINSDLSFVGSYVIQGNFSGYQVWDISEPSRPTLHTAYVCPGSQSDVSVYGTLMFVSGEAMNGRTDCGTQGVPDTVSQDRLRGIRIFDITDIAHPKYLTNVQTCRGSHTHTVVTDPRDRANVYIYISGTAPVRSPHELAGCSDSPLQDDPNTALFRIEVIRVPLAAPQQAKIVSSPRIFGGLTEPASHGETPQDVAVAAQAAAEARARGAYTVTMHGMEHVVSRRFINPLLDSIVAARGGTGAPTAADSAALRPALQGIVDQMMHPTPVPTANAPDPPSADITVSWVGLAAGRARATDSCSISATCASAPHRRGGRLNFSFCIRPRSPNNDGTKIPFRRVGRGLQPAAA